MNIKSLFGRNKNSDNTPVTGVDAATGENKAEDIFKAYIPNFLYRPPFGMPRRVNTPQLKELAKNPFVFSVIKTLCDEATSVGWKIKVKEEFNVQANPVEEEKDSPGLKVDYDEKIKEITRFFDNPNGNEESFNHLLRQVITDICEVDSGVFIKVFNQAGEFKQLFARDGSLFLKNPDIYGYMGDRREFVAPLPDGFTGVNIDVGGTPTTTQQQIMKQYSLLFKEDAAYFQYGWTAGSLPVPFGKREICYIMQNPRGDSIYGRSPVEVLMNTILNLIYGIDFNLDFYTNNNMPSGAIQLLGAQQAQIAQFRENFENNFRFEDEFGKKRKKFFKFPISSSKVEFTPFQMNAKEMDIIAQQEWFTKVLWMAFGVNSSEMGFTEDSNKSIDEGQIKTFKRKAIKPLLQVIQYHINTQIMPEFFAKTRPNQVGELPGFGDIPLEFTFDMYDIDEDTKELDKLKKELDLGIKTSEMIAKERGINIDELREGKESAMKIAKENMPEEDKNGEKEEEKTKPVEEKAIEDMTPVSEIEKHIDNLGREIVKNLEIISDDEIQQSY